MSHAMDDNDGVPASLHEVYVPPAQRKQVASVEYHGDAAVDIVFVHGLGSKIATTWAYKRQDGSRYHWLREQLPLDMPDARVLMYEYASRWYEDPVHTDLRECAAQFLHTLILDRQHAFTDALCRTRRKRPLILVGHSFGGLVIKQAMSMASHVLESSSRHQFESNRDVLSAIAGVIFLGTPHRGSSFTKLAGIKSWFGKSVLRVQTNDEIINILTPSSLILHWAQQEFDETCADERLEKLRLICYYEMRDVPIIRRRVVSQEYATLDSAASRGMNANHMDMNTFFAGDNGQKDHNYDLFISDIRMLFSHAPPTVSERFQKWSYGSSGHDAVRERLQRALNASREAQDSAYSRYLRIHESAPYTCQWIHELKTFKQWEDDLGSNRTLWIRGHGGTGKSVLTAYIINHLRQARSEWSACSNAVSNQVCGARRTDKPVLYFFCGLDRSSELVERILGSLMHQLLLARPDDGQLVEMADRMVQGKITSEALIATMASMVALVGHVFLLIDNLEDMMYSETDNILVLLQLLSTLQKQADVRILILSQETEQVRSAIAQSLASKDSIPITDYTAHDISSFTQARSSALVAKRPALGQKEQVIKESLNHRAQGSFQWVNSAFEHLKDIEDVRDVEPQLEDIKDDLLESYDKVFKGLLLGRTDRIARRIDVCLKLMAASATTITCADAKTAWLIREKMEHKATAKQDFEDLFDQDGAQEWLEVAADEVRNYLGSIVDVLPDQTLHFKHLSYLKALTRIQTLEKEDKKAADRVKFTVDEAHADIALICMTACRYTTLVHANSFIDWRIPLLQYAWSFWAYHLQRSDLGFLTAEESAAWEREAKLRSVADPRMERRLELQAALDSMVTEVQRDALLYLEALVDFISRPLQAVPGHFSDRDYVLALQRAQESLIQPARDLCSLSGLRVGALSSKLEQVRQETARVKTDAHWRNSKHNEITDGIASTRTTLLGPDSSVRSLRADTYLRSDTALPRPAGEQKLLLDMTRGLRTIALRFSVDPIYSALLVTAGGTSFSPLHPLVYLAQFFEEIGTYPYWKSVPPGRDLMEPFLCPNSDPEYASAKFVLHCFEWRDPRESETLTSPATVPQAGFYIRTAHFAIDVRPSPNPSALGLRRVSTENFEQVKRLHRVKAEHFWAAQQTYGLFQGQKESIYDMWVSRPLANLHMKYSLLVHDRDDPVNPFEDPQDGLMRHIPDEVQEAPLKTFLRSLPHIIGTYLVQYVVFVLEVFGQLAKRALGVHVAKVEAAIVELNQVKVFADRLYNPGIFPSVKPLHFAAAGVLFALRCWLFPSWGAYIWYHSWDKFSWAWNHPTAYVEIQKDYRFWTICFQIFMNFLNLFAAQMAVGMTMQETLAGSPVLDASFTYAIFNSCCAIERSIFAIVSAGATLLACGLIMFTDLESVSELMKFSMLFWFMRFLDLIFIAIRLRAAEHGGGWVAGLLPIVLQSAVLFLVIRNIMFVRDSLYTLAKPARMLAVFIYKVVFRTSVFAAKTAAICLLFYIVARAFFSVHSFIWDPYDVKSSLKELISASAKIQETLRQEEKQRIGYYPLGERRREIGENQLALTNGDRGPSHILPPLETSLANAQKHVDEAATNFVTHVGERFGSGVGIQTRLDRMVLATGDQVGSGIDLAMGGLRYRVAEERVVERIEGVEEVEESRKDDDLQVGHVKQL